jgi:hypothetical protein
MAWSSSAPGIDEARLDTIVARMQSLLGDLNAALSRDDKTPVPTITTDMIALGEPESGWSLSDGGVIMCVVGGGERDAQDFTADFISSLTPGAPNNGWKYVYSTNIYIYQHPDLFTGQNLSSRRLASMRERTRSRIQDWLVYDVWNVYDGVSLTIGSNILNSSTAPPGSDYLAEGFIARGYKGYFPKSFGKMTMAFGAHYVHVAKIA